MPQNSAIPSAATPSDTPAAPALAISATFTADTMRAPLEFWMRELGLDYRVRFAAYNQVFQTLLDATGLFATNRSGINVVLVRFEDWLRFQDGELAGIEAIEENVRSLISSVRSAAQAFPVPLLVCVCPPSPAFVADLEKAAAMRLLEELLAVNLSGLNSVYWLATADLASLYPVSDSYDVHGDKSAHVPYTPEFFAALATFLARKVHALRMLPYKVIALDCDNTLWGGICGEDEPGAIQIDAPRRALQEFMKAQREAGMLLCLCSKNNEEDVFETFRLHPDMPLQREHFTAWRINWEPKSGNLLSLAEELGLGLDSFIFVEDDAKECAEVQADCPEVLTLALPVETNRIPFFLRHIWAFDHPRVTTEDRNRTASYAQHIERGRFEKQAASLEQFLAGLQLRVNIAPMLASQLPRVSQLTRRTSQMNFTTIRRSESELSTLLADGRMECLTVDASDRFGAYGLVGVMLFEPANDASALRLDTFLLSCRALGRGIEHRMLAHVASIARDRGYAIVEVRAAPTAKNRPALLFLESIGWPHETEASGDLLFRFPLDVLVHLRHEPGATKTGGETLVHAEAPKPDARQFTDFVRIANELSIATQVLARVRPARGRVIPAAAPTDPPRTELEGLLAGIWTELLGINQIGVRDNFFDLGGHSLLAVQLLSRVRQRLGVDLSLDVVYSGNLTIAELAQAIEIQEMGQVDPGQYASILAELEGLSDDEVKSLLAAEEPATLEDAS